MFEANEYCFSTFKWMDTNTIVSLSVLYFNSYCLNYQWQMLGKFTDRVLILRRQSRGLRGKVIAF